MKQVPTRFRWLLGIGLLVLFLLLLAAVYLESPYVKVRSVVVQGATGLSNQLIADVNINAGANMFTVNSRLVANRLLADFPILKTVSVRRNLIRQQIIIVVQEKKVAGLLDSGGVLYRLLSDGTVIDTDPEGVGVNLPIITTATPLTVNLGVPVSDPDIVTLCQEFIQIPTETLSSFSEFHLEIWRGSTAVLAYGQDGFEVRMPLTSLASSLRLYASIHSKLLQLHRKPGLIDLISNKEGIYTPF